MRPVANKLDLYLFKFSNFIEKYKKFLIAGTTFWLGIGILIFGIVSVKNSIKETTFAAQQITPAEALRAIKIDKKQNRPFTLVIYKTGCPDCAKVEKKMVRQLIELERDSKTEYIVFDAAKMTKKQKMDLISEVPQITLQGRKIYFPTVAVFNVKKHQAQLVNISQTTAEKTYSSVLEDSKEVGEKK